MFKKREILGKENQLFASRQGLLCFWLIATFAASSDWVSCLFEGGIYNLILI